MRVTRIEAHSTVDALAFLERQPHTALFLLSNLSTYGPSLTDEPYSGDFKGIVDDAGQLIAVFCLTRHGVLLVETHGRVDLAPLIMSACETTGIAIAAVIAERGAADAVWPAIKAVPGFRVTWESPERLYRLDLTHWRDDAALDPRVRLLVSTDFTSWNHANLAYLTEVGMALGGKVEERRLLFDEHTTRRRWWGLFEDDRLTTTAGLNAMYKDLAQVGAVYTVPDRRRVGLSRATMRTLLVDARDVHHVRRLVLFTGESNNAAERLYRGLGFEIVGEYGVYFGTHDA